MQAKTQKNEKVAVFLHRSALCLLILPAACLLWALRAYSPQNAFWFCFALAAYSWPFAGVLWVVSAAFHTGEKKKHEIGMIAKWRAAHGH